ncbi:MAG TPA: SLBB domain-containing protein [Candidatus Eisenbacteria bacterium]|nr:SLBB domain-containing protein [Candidatus Eisenbacteria bacterium]
MPDAGAIAVAGLTLRQVEANAREALRPFVRGKGFVLTLHRPRRFRAMVVGDVDRPGSVLLQAPVRASEAIAAAGGITWQGARRGIIVRRGADSLLVDLMRFERNGDEAANPFVFETDVIVVPTADRRVDVLGAVAHPGGYDWAPGDRVSLLLAAAGGTLAKAALDRITVGRETAPGRREEFVLDASDDRAIEPGDHLFVPERAHWGAGSSVTIEGEVVWPGPYSITDGADRLGALLSRAGGYTEWADSAAIRIERTSDAATRDSAFVRLARDQGSLVTESERDYLVSLTRERRAISVSAPAWAKAGLSVRDLPLLDGDRIIVPRRSLTVMVQGEVRAPGHVPFELGRSVGDYVAAAGGYTKNANKGRVRVTLASTGRPVGASDVDALHAGDIVWVPAKAPRSSWATLRDVLTTLAQVATIYLVIDQATK